VTPESERFFDCTAPLLRQKALDLVDAAITTLHENGPDRDKAVHDVRRRLKELRAVAELLRNRLPRHGRSDRELFRDAGRSLASARDSKAAVEAFDRLREHYAGEWTPRQFLKIRGALSRRVASELGTQDAHMIVIALIDALVTERRRVAAWPVDGMRQDELWDAIRRSYRRSRRAMSAAIETKSPALFHRWRRRVKTHWYHTQLLTRSGLAQLDERSKGLRKLSRILGNHHDLAVIDQLLDESPEEFGSPAYVKRFRGFVTRRMRKLEDDAQSLGAELFEERTRSWEAQTRPTRRRGPKQAVRRIGEASAATASSA
jgi:hypothetical protein